jgi:4-hydroxy-3-polyprenylbenzoate decarboxylase
VAYNDLREWIAALDKAGELKRIQEPVSPRLEITEITDRVSKSGKVAQSKAGAPRAAL